MASVNETRPLGELFGGLANDLSGLFRKEVQLAKAEAGEKVSQAIGGVELLLAGAVLALGALGVLLAAAVTAIGALLMSMGLGEGAAEIWSAVIVGVVVALIAWALVARGLGQLKANNLMLDRTAHALGRDAEAVKERL